MLLLPTIQAHVDSRQSIIFPVVKHWYRDIPVTSAAPLFLAFVKHRPNLCFMRSDNVTGVSETLSNYNQNISCGFVALDSIKIARSSYYQEHFICSLFFSLVFFFFPLLFFAETVTRFKAAALSFGDSKQFYILRWFVKSLQQISSERATDLWSRYAHLSTFFLFNYCSV